MLSPSLETTHYSWPQGQCKRDEGDPRRFTQTLTGVKLPDIFQNSPASTTALYQTNTKVHLLNGDSCLVGQHVIVQRQSGGAGVDQPFVACVHEIIQQVGSTNHANNQPDGILLQTLAHVSDETSGRLRMPHLVLQDEWSFVRISVSLFFSYDYQNSEVDNNIVGHCLYSQHPTRLLPPQMPNDWYPLCLSGAYKNR